MRTHELQPLLATADPVDWKRLRAVDLGATEADLLADLEGVPSGLREPAPRPWRSRPRRLTFALAVAALASAVVAFLFATGREGGHPSRAYGAELVRFAESTPLLLLDEPWRVQSVYEAGEGAYMPRSSRGEGSMEFVTGPAIPYESTTISADGTVRGMAPKAVRQRKVELRWHPGKLGFPGPIVHRPVEAPVLDATALVNTRAETAYIVTRTEKKRIESGGPGDRQMAAIWHEGGYTLELRAWVPNLAGFKERLDWLSRVDSETWLDAMPAKVVKSTEHDAAVREMLKGIPVPSGFRPSQIPDEGLTTNRYQVGASVAGIVSCLWFRQWGKARRAHDRAAEEEAERAMASSKRWPILHEMAKDGAYPETVWKLAAEMPSGYREYAGHRWRLLPQAEALGCARWGLPVLPRKQQLQRERRNQ
ncbi:MAG TPA: hypothetical protein VG898_05330 [Solirubrobacterales bacterium]|nr:hypothetical protein [Solirubrobacterales bacterium]